MFIVRNKQNWGFLTLKWLVFTYLLVGRSSVSRNIPSSSKQPFTFELTSFAVPLESCIRFGDVSQCRQFRYHSRRKNSLGSSLKVRAGRWAGKASRSGKYPEEEGSKKARAIDAIESMVKEVRTKPLSELKDGRKEGEGQGRAGQPLTII